MIPEILPKDILLVISVKLVGVVVKGCVFDKTGGHLYFFQEVTDF